MGSKFLLEADYWSDLNNRNSMGLHSEASFSSVWPEIVWFFCNKPSKKEREKLLFVMVYNYGKPFPLSLKSTF